MPIIIETQRLIMKQFCEDDAACNFELNVDPEVNKYTSDGPYNSMDEVYEFIRGYDQYEKYGMGRLNMFDKKTGEYIGWCGLKYLEDEKYVDIGYRLLKKHWGKGYATEAAVASIEYGFDVLNLDKIFGKAMKENTASINVFKKLGMVYSHDDECGAHAGMVYVITKDQWK